MNRCQDFKLAAAIIIMVFAFIIAMSITLSYIQCKAKAHVLGYVCDYDIFAGCVLQKGSDKVLLEQLRQIR